MTRLRLLVMASLAAVGFLGVLGCDGGGGAVDNDPTKVVLPESTIKVDPNNPNAPKGTDGTSSGANAGAINQ